MDKQMKQDAQVLMEVVRRGKVEDQERVRLSTLAFLFGMRAALGGGEMATIAPEGVVRQ